MAIQETVYLLGILPIYRREVKPPKSTEVIERTKPWYIDFSNNPSVYRRILIILGPDKISKVLTSKRIGGVVFKSKNAQPPTETFSMDEINKMPRVSGSMGFLQKKFSWTA